MGKKPLFTFLTVLVFLTSNAQEETKRVFGTITDGAEPLKDVSVIINHGDSGVTSNNQGKYELQVKEGDILTFSHVGMRTLNFKVEDVTRVLNVTMYYDVEELENVTVTEKATRGQENLRLDYKFDKNIIYSSFGFMDASGLGYNLRIIDQEDIIPGTFELAQVVQGRFPGIRVERNSNGVNIYLRMEMGFAGSPAAYDIDGILYTEYPFFLDPQNIDRIGLIASRSGLTRYGNLASGGVILINTKTGMYSPKEEGTTSPYDYARLRDNRYMDNALDKDDLAKNYSGFQKELHQSQNKEEAVRVYKTSLKQYGFNFHFVLDSYQYFIEKWNDEVFAKTIVEENRNLFESNPIALKALAYFYESRNKFEKANELYKEVFILRPDYAQSYLDMAESYRDVGQPKNAVAIYTRYEYLLNSGYLASDSIGFMPIMNREFNNLLMAEKESVLDKSKVNELYVAEEDFRGTRLVFEWNDSNAEFELQFVNPEKHYFTYPHTMLENVETIERCNKYGYNTTEFLIDGALPGTWQVNVNYLGNKSLTTTYLKATVYYNYGSRSQSKEVKVFKLALKNVNQELFKLAANGSMVLK